MPAFPLDAWGYGKHGETHRISAELLYSTDKTFKSNMNTIAKKSGGKSLDFDYLSTYTLFNYVPTKWKNIKDYYTAEPKKLFFTEKLHLYTFCHDYLAPTRIGGTSTKEGIKMISGISSSVYEPIAAYLLNGVVGGSYLNDTHQMYTYYEALKTGYFNNIEWIPQLGNSIDFFAASAAGTEYNSEQVEVIKSFLSNSNNAELLGWDIDDPATWNTIIWNEAGNAESVSFYYTGLSGDLDLSGFSDLKTLICPGNNITSINLDGCDSLEALDCSENALTELDVSSSVLIALNCNGNYLDTENMAKFKDMENNGVMVSCDNQNPRENAVFDETDVSILKNALGDTNILDLSAEPQNWYGIDWEKQNGVYRCVGIDIRGLGVEAPLDLSGLNALRYLYCSDNKLDSLDVSGCGSLENLGCSNCELRELNIDNTAISYLNCEENYFDTQTQEEINSLVESVGGESVTGNQLQHIEMNLDKKYASLISVSLEYSGENIYLTISSLNGTDISENIPTVIHASYDGELMTAFEALSPEKKDDGSYVYTDENIGSDKIMLWDNLNNMKPLAEPAELDLRR